MGKLLQILLFTIRDMLRQKSVYILLAGCILLLLLVRGCYSAEFNVNGRVIDTAHLTAYISVIAFQLICYAMFPLAILLAMKIVTRDKADGAMVMFLCRPVARWQYVIGRILGAWVVSALFLMVLQGVLMVIVWSQTGGMLTSLLPGALIAALNLLCIITLVFLLSLLMPDFVAAAAGFAIIAVGFFSEAGYQLLQGKLFQAVTQGNIPADSSLWRILYPKLNMLQYYAGTVVAQSDFHGMGQVHPLINVLIYILGAMTLSLFLFRRMEV